LKIISPLRNKRFKGTFGSHTTKTFDRFATEDSFTWNITHNMKNIALWNFKPERWGSPLVQEKCQEGMGCDKGHNDDDNDDHDDDDDDNVKTKVTPVIIGGTGTISKSFRKYLSSVPGKHDIKELQKTAVLGTAHTAGSANVEAQNSFTF
jgi:hypothetical protein